MKKGKMESAVLLVILLAITALTWTHPAGAATTISMSGTVYDKNGLPVSGVTVQQAGNATVTTTTGSNGTYTLAGLPKGTVFQIQLTKSGYQKTYGSNMAFSANIPVLNWNLMPASYYSSLGNTAGKGLIAGRVCDGSDTSSYISGATVTATGNISGSLAVVYPEDPESGTGTLISGRFVVKNVTAGETVTVTASKDGMTFPAPTFNSYGDGVTIGLVRGTADTGTVWYTSRVTEFVSNTPVAGATIELDSDSSVTTTSAADGSYTLVGITKNTPVMIKTTKEDYAPTYMVLPALPGNIYSPYKGQWLLTTSQLRALGNEEGHGAIFGFTTLYSGFPVSGMTITATGAEGPYPIYYDAPGDTSTSSNGGFWVNNVTAGYTVTFTASRDGFSFAPAPISPPDDGPTLFPYFGLAPAGVGGFVRDKTTGAAISHATVTLLDGSGDTVSSVFSSGDGSFYLGVGSGGNYSITAKHSQYNDFPSKAVTVPSSEDVDAGNLLMTPGASLSLDFGWNLISLPVKPAAPAVSSVLSGISGFYQVVWAYEHQAWKVYDPNDKAGSTLTTMEAGTGYWIKMSAAKPLTVSGTEPSASVLLSSGWNLVGYNGTACILASKAVLSLGETFQLLWGYPSGNWKSYTNTADDFATNALQLCPNEGYWIKANDVKQWTLPLD